MNSTPILPTNITVGSNGITALRVTEYVLFTIIFIVSVIGNVLVCLVIYKTPSMRTTRNYLIVNLAVADLTVALVCIPFDVVIKVYGSPWPLGVAMCKVVWPSMTLVTTCSAATLLAISYDRYQAVLRLWEFSSLQTTAVIAATWLLSLLLVIPYIVALRITENGKCSEEWLNTTIRQLYTLGLFVFQYALPLFFIVVAYSAVVIKLHKQANDLIGAGKGLKREYSKRRDGGLLLSSLSKESPSTRSHYPSFPAINAKSEAKRIERNKKIVKMLMSVVSLYAICLLPNQVVWLWMEFRSRRESFDHFDHSLLTFSSLLVYINSSINPMLYAGMNKEFRKGFAKALGFRLKTQELKKKTKGILKHDVAASRRDTVNL